MESPTFGSSVEADGDGASSDKGGIELICREIIEYQAINIGKRRK